MGILLYSECVCLCVWIYMCACPCIYVPVYVCTCMVLRLIVFLYLCVCVCACMCENTSVYTFPLKTYKKNTHNIIKHFKISKRTNREPKNTTKRTRAINTIEQCFSIFDLLGYRAPFPFRVTARRPETADENCMRKEKRKWIYCPSPQMAFVGVCNLVLAFNVFNILVPEGARILGTLGYGFIFSVCVCILFKSRGATSTCVNCKYIRLYIIT